MNADEIVWEDPPSASKTGPKPYRDWDAFAADLRDHPGKWAVARVGTRTNAWNTKTRIRGLGVEVEVRQTGPGEWTAYARWMDDAS